MSHVCHCDICGKTTYLNPPTEIEFEEKEIHGVKVKHAKVAIIKQQNPFTQEIEDKEIPKRTDLKPRAYMVQLQIGPSEMIQRDFCIDCLQTVKPHLVKIWSMLEAIKPQ